MNTFTIKTKVEPNLATKKAGIKGKEMLRKGYITSSVKFMSDVLEDKVTALGVLKKVISDKALKAEKEIKQHELSTLQEEILKLEQEKRMVITTITTASVDRDGEIVRPDGMNLKGYNGIVLAGHNYHGLGTGRNIWIKASPEGRDIIAKTEYAENKIGHEYFEWRKNGFPMATSIGFLPVSLVSRGEPGFNKQIDDLVERGWLEAKDIPKVNRIYTKWFLLEYSDVTVPANPEAQEIAISKGIFPSDEVPFDLSNMGAHKLERIKSSKVLNNTHRELPISEASTLLKDLTHNSKLHDSELSVSSVVITKLPLIAFVGTAQGTDQKIKSTWKFPHHFVDKGSDLDAGTEVYTKGDLFLHQGLLNKAWKEANEIETPDKAVINHLKVHRDALGQTDEEKTLLQKIDHLTDRVEALSKATDPEGSPSVHDIMVAILFSLNDNTITRDTKSFIADIYPIHYPNGHVVIEMPSDSDIFVDWDYSYDHDSKRAVLTNPRAVEETWIGKGLSIGKAGRVLSAKNRTSVTTARDALTKVLEDDKEEPKGVTIISTSNKKLHIEALKLEMQKMKSHIMLALKYKMEQNKKEVCQEVDAAIALERGKVVYEEY